MRVNRRELTLWSFLMSSAHGAGLMVAPVLIGRARRRVGAQGHDLRRRSASLTPSIGVGASASRCTCSRWSP